MTTRLQLNILKGVLLIILFILLMLGTVGAQAQSFNKRATNPYKGFVVTFGSRSATLSSDIQKINHTELTQAGGQVGVTIGLSFGMNR